MEVAIYNIISDNNDNINKLHRISEKRKYFDPLKHSLNHLKV